MYVEMKQGNSLSRYLKSQKCDFFSFTESENRTEEYQPGRVVAVGDGRKW
jgi:hypothetical protein